MYEIKKIEIESDKYPQLLRQIYNPPKQLYVVGNVENLNLNCVTIVGTRFCSSKGRRITKHIAYELAKSGYCIVSGLAVGIDRKAHEGALQARGKTIAILPGGVDCIYPSENKDLAEQILKRGGTLISEYPPGSAVLIENFAQRSRLLGGISSATIITEARKQSGAMNTVKQAINENREIIAVPWSIKNRNGIGNNQLIKMRAKPLLLKDLK